MTKVRSLLAVLSVLVLGVGVTACGSDSDSDSGSNGDTGTGTTQTADGIEGVTWKLMNIGVQGSASSLPANVDAPTLEFEDGEVQVFNGCNSGSGPAEITDKTIEFGPIALTKKGCDQVASQIEQYFSYGTKGDVKYETTQGNLVLEGKQQVSLVFTQE